MTFLTFLWCGEELEISYEKISFSTITKLLIAGWTAFFLSLIISVIFYSVHPSQVQVFTVKEKLQVNICGYNFNCR